MQAVKDNGETKKLAEAAKAKGNAAFSKNQFDEAIKAFTEAISHDANNETYFSNRAASYTQRGRTGAATDFDLALADAEMCIKLKANWTKGYVRKGAALFYKKSFKEAKKAYDEGLKIDATDKALLEGMAQADDMMEESKKSKKGEEKGDGNHVIGIDLGTTYSCVGYWKDKGVVIIPNDRGDMTTPSYVGFSQTGKRSVGHIAKADAPRYPKSTIFDAKRIIGKEFKEDGVTQDIKRFPFPVVEGDNGKPGIVVDMGLQGKKVFAPEEISAFVLGYLKRCSEKFLGCPVTQAVITVPAYFNDAQRAATKAAGAIAGLDVLRIINEPTAAALAYGLDHKLSKQSESVTILVFDLGGGTFDVSILRIHEGIFEVKATGGDTRLGGEDFDHNVAEYLFKEMEAKDKGYAGVSQDARARKRLLGAIEKAKRELSQTDKATITIDALVAKSDNGPQKNYTYELTRKEFEQINRTYFQNCLDTVKAVLKDAQMAPSAIDEIVLVGGSTRVPKIQEMLSEYFGGKSLCKTLNPDEAVAYGAAVQGAILSGKRSKETKDLLLMDVTPLSLGIETTGRVMSVVIPRNTPIPCVRTQVYTTEENYQTAVDVVVFEGERAKTDDNHELGKFTISGIERAKRGEPKVDVSFSIDSNGMLNVTARDQKTGAEEKIDIARGGRASDADIERMTKEAALYAKQDAEAAEIQEARNELEGKIFNIKEMASTLKDKHASKRDELETACESAEEWLEKNEDTLSVNDITSRIAKLSLLYNKTAKQIGL